MEMPTLRALLHAMAQTMRHPDPAAWADEVLHAHDDILAATVAAAEPAAPAAPTEGASA